MRSSGTILLSILGLSVVLLFTHSLNINSIFQFGGFKSKSNLKTLKNEILSISKKVDRGLTETTEDRLRIAELFNKIESYNTQNATLSNRGGARKVGPILQTIDAINLKAENKEVRKYLIFDIPFKVTAELTPSTPSRVDVQFKVFTIGPLSFAAPNSFQSWLDTTYVDEDIRLSRGSLGNIFVLSKYSDL